jgi:hypothetical protein
VYSYLFAAIVVVTTQPALAADEQPKKPEFLSPQEVEGEAKRALVTVLGYFADSDKELKTFLMTRDGLVPKIKELKESGETPKTLEKTKKDRVEPKTAVLKQQASLVEGLVPPDGFNTHQNAVKRPPDYWVTLSPKTKEEGAKNAATYCSGLLQFIDKDHRAVLKRVHGLESDKAKFEKSLKLAEDPADKETLQKKLKDTQAKLDAEAKAAADSRRALLLRLVEELNEGRGVPPAKLYSTSDKD